MSRPRWFWRVMAVMSTALIACGPETVEPVQRHLQWEARDRATIASPFLLFENAMVRVTVYHDVIVFGDGVASRSARMVQFNKAARDTTLLAPSATETFSRDGVRVRITHSATCVGITVCPEHEEGTFVGDTLFMASRYAGFQTLRYVRVILED